MSNLVRRDATSTSGGELTPSAQTIPGAKTFTGATTFSENTTGLLVTKWNASSALAGTDGSSGLYKAGSAPGLTTGAAIPAGYVGEMLTSTFSGVTITTSGVTLTTRSLNKGTYLVLYYANATKGSATRVSIASDTTLSSGTLTNYCNDFQQDVLTTSVSLTGSATALVTADGATLNFAARSVGASTSADANGRLVCIRIA
jgi:hypothetical protein